MAISISNSLENIAAGISPFANILMLFGRSQEEWDITEASYNDVKFHIFESRDPSRVALGGLARVSDRGGRRKVKLKFPYQDGQTTDDLGREAEDFEVEVVLFGKDYKLILRDLMTELQKPTPGTLVHPVRGSIPCGMLNYEMVHESNTRKAVLLRITFTEHNFTVADITQLKGSDVSKFGRAISAALAMFKAFDSALNTIRAAQFLSQTIRALLEQIFTQYRNEYGTSLASINRVFNPLPNPGISVLLPVQEGGLKSSSSSFSVAATTTEQNTLISDNFRTTISPDDPFAKVPLVLLTGQTQQAVSSLQVQKQVNQTRATLQTLLDAIKQVGSPGTPGLSVDANGDPDFTGVDSTGSIEFAAETVTLKQSIVTLQIALETGIASQRVKIVKYTTPRLMSTREIAFANKLDVEKSDEIDLLNPELPSVNYVAAGTVVLVPV